ncbi:hypothetical protein HK101_011473 [Irineochytrium annulatum]|nr:hypothetical protein HK101_011473 [Irineochytrium annulatum]
MFASSRAATPTRISPLKSVGLAGQVQRRWLTDDLKSKLEKVVKENDIVVFMKGTKNAPQCGFSKRVVDILNVTGAEYQTINVLADADVREGIKAYSSWPTIPQVYVKGEFVGGSDILFTMLQNGELEALFEKEGLIEPMKEEEKK